jgi:IS605 OrfB family transposase
VTWSRLPPWPRARRFALLAPLAWRRRLGAAAARRAARRSKGSDRRRTAALLRANAHQHSARQRRDCHHQEASTRVHVYDVISREDLRFANLVQNHHRAQSIQDAGWGALLAILTFKAAHAGKRVQAVNPMFTSQRCSGLDCGVIVQQGRVGALACLPAVWDQPASRPPRGAQHPAAGARAQEAGRRPSGVTVVGCHRRSLRTHGALAPVECQRVPLQLGALRP